MARCHQAPSHYLSQCWPSYLLSYEVNWPQWVNPLAEFLLRNLKICLHLLSFLNTEMAQVLESFFVEDKDLFILHNQHHGCCRSGDARSHVISIHGTDFVLLEYSSFSSGGIKPFCGDLNISDKLDQYDMPADAMAPCLRSSAGIILAVWFEQVFDKDEFWKILHGFHVGKWSNMQRCLWFFKLHQHLEG